MVYKFVNAVIDQLQLVQATQQCKKPTGMPHGKSKKTIAGPCPGSQPVPAIYLQAIGCQQHQPVKQAGLRLVKPQRHTSAKTISQEAEWRSKDVVQLLNGP